MDEGEEIDFTHLVQGKEIFVYICGSDNVWVFAAGMVMKLSRFCHAPLWAQNDLVFVSVL